jgi:ferredoxin
MKVTVDFDICQSNAVCMEIAPKVFEEREDGYHYIMIEEPPD